MVVINYGEYTKGWWCSLPENQEYLSHHCVPCELLQFCSTVPLGVVVREIGPLHDDESCPLKVK